MINTLLDWNNKTDMNPEKRTNDLEKFNYQNFSNDSRLICRINETDGSASNEFSQLDDETLALLSKEFSFTSSNGNKWVSSKSRSTVAINKNIWASWKSLNNHYLKYSDIKAKDQYSKLTHTNQISPTELVENLNEWKFHYLISQVNSLIDYENESLSLINDVDDLIQNSNFDGLSDICLKINESIKANSQRHKYVNEQLDETQILIHKFFEHKEKFQNFLIASSEKAANEAAIAAANNNDLILESNKAQSNRKVSKSNINKNINRKKFTKASVSRISLKKSINSSKIPKK